MSLINDALKRAKQAHTEKPTPPPELPFRAAEPSQPRNAGLPILPLAALAVVLALGIVFVIVALQKRDAAPQVVHATQSDTVPTLAAAPIQPTPVTTTPTGTVPVSPSDTTTTVPAQPLVAVASPATELPSGTVEAPTVGVNPEPPQNVLPKLQGIFYHPNRPSAVVNGRTAYIGSRVGETRDFLVLDIGRESITVAKGSQTNLLVLED